LITPEKHSTRPLIKHSIRLTVLVCIVGSLVLYLTWPTVGLLKAESCMPNGAIAEFSALVHGKQFWIVQLGDIRRQREEAENWERIQADSDQRASENIEQMDRVLSQTKEQMNRIYENYPNLAPSNEDDLAEQLRERARRLNAEADDIELRKGMRIIREKIQQQLPALRKCESFIAQKLR